MVEIDEDWEEWNPKKTTFFHHVVAGSSAGLVEHVSIFPIDTVKTHLQCQRCPLQKSTAPLGAWATAKDLIETGGGVRRLFRGVSAMFGACIPAHAAYFSIFESAKIALNADGPQHTPVASGLAGVCATISHDSIMTPMDVVKQRLQLGYYTGTTDCIKTILAEEGPRALYRSFPTTLLMNVPYGMVMVASNETLKLILNPTGEHNTMAYFVSGALSGALAGLLTNPLDVAKTRLQTQMMVQDSPVSTSCARAASRVLMEVPASCSATMTERTVSSAASSIEPLQHPHLKLQYKGLVDALSQIKNQEGLGGLFRGVVPRVLVHAPSVAISWTTYEVVKKALDDLGYF